MPDRRTVALVIAAVGASLLGCNRASPGYTPTFSDLETGPKTYSFGVHPLHNPALLQKTYGPLIDYLNARSARAKFRLVSSRDYASYDRRLMAGEFDLALPNPYETVVASAAGYRVFGKVGNDDKFRGIILTRSDSSVKTILDLRGRTISYPAPTAVAAAMLPQYFLQQHGVSLNSTKVVYVGSMESAIESVLSGRSDAAAVWPDPWQKYILAHPTDAKQLAVRWVTPSLVNNGLVVRRSLPPEIARGVLAHLRQLPTTSEGHALLKHLEISRFDPANNTTYRPARQFLQRFSRTVRPLPGLTGAAA